MRSRQVGRVSIESRKTLPLACAHGVSLPPPNFPWKLTTAVDPDRSCASATRLPISIALMKPIQTTRSNTPSTQELPVLEATWKLMSYCPCLVSADSMRFSVGNSSVRDQSVGTLAWESWTESDGTSIHHTAHSSQQLQPTILTNTAGCLITALTHALHPR
ncbi:uncharacterized protein BJ171DRAFT_25995 [Polychytrium aggregatum]|uniref:uncharacterized protein n=1 Tax=Polychytrium aggregatum TaxID=110093 RepID=UPI0022FE2869|nr:uncharacterized protein BJ171DRAFT_25995 [Polychytrium aggregatum]KAI9192950.1 hypothetical protein BJ171DRAFT_25995 [Polychytrium aggregatum]